MINTKGEAYEIHKRSGGAGRQSDRVLAYIRKCSVPPLRDEIATALGMLTTSVCGRLNELMHDGLVEVAGQRVNPRSSVQCDTYRAVRHEPVAQASLFEVAA